MKILKSVQDNFAILGINLNQLTHHAFNLKTLMIILVFGVAIISSYVSIFRAHSFKEYTDSIHVGFAFTLGSAIFAIVICKMTKMSELIGGIETIIIESE